MDKLLINFLDEALKLTNTKCSSIMIVDDKNNDLTIRVSRGIDDKIAQKTHTKIGEGIAGIVARDKVPL